MREETTLRVGGDGAVGELLGRGMDRLQSYEDRRRPPLAGHRAQTMSQRRRPRRTRSVSKALYTHTG